MALYQDIADYIPENEQEAADKALLLSWLSVPDVFIRENKTAHMTASAWVVSPDRSRVLMVYHNLYHSWSWMGGHADGDEDLLRVARREVQEESGLENLIQLTPGIFSLEILSVDGHIKRGCYVSTHLHLNVTYLFQADPSEKLRIKPDENSGVAWIPVAELPEKVTEPWFLDHIYNKLTGKISRLGL